MLPLVQRLDLLLARLRARQGACSCVLVVVLGPRLPDSAACLFALLSSNACTLLVCHLDLFVTSLRVMWQPTGIGRGPQRGLDGTLLVCHFGSFCHELARHVAAHGSNDWFRSDEGANGFCVFFCFRVLFMNQ